MARLGNMMKCKTKRQSPRSAVYTGQLRINLWTGNKRHTTSTGVLAVLFAVSSRRWSVSGRQLSICRESESVVEYGEEESLVEGTRGRKMDDVQGTCQRPSHFYRP